MQNFILAPFVCHFHLLLSIFRTHIIHKLKLTELRSTDNINYKQSPLVPGREERSFTAKAFAAVAFEVLPTSTRGI